MFNGMPTRLITAAIICAQISAMFFAIAIPGPQSLAREAKMQFEVSDVPMESPMAEDGLIEETGWEGCVADVEESADVTAAISDEPPEEVFEATCDANAGTDDCGSDAAMPIDADDLKSRGVIYDGGYRYTWYSQRVLPGGGLAIEGRHVSDEGYVVDAGERIVVASSDLPHGTELDVPFGSGKAVVLDTGCASGTIDVYTDF